jgi:quercetin dioxygenase-like cupin family protein
MNIDFTKATQEGYTQAGNGIRRKTLVYGQNEMLCEFRLEHDNLLPLHSHPAEQAGYLVSGHIVLHYSGVAHDVLPGDSWCIPGGVEHSADVLEDSVAIEVFSPLRPDYLP